MSYPSAVACAFVKSLNVGEALGIAARLTLDILSFPNGPVETTFAPVMPGTSVIGCNSCSGANALPNTKFAICALLDSVAVVGNKADIVFLIFSS